MTERLSAPAPRRGGRPRHPPVDHAPSWPRPSGPRRRRRVPPSSWPPPLSWPSSARAPRWPCDAAPTRHDRDGRATDSIASRSAAYAGRRGVRRRLDRRRRRRDRHHPGHRCTRSHYTSVGVLARSNSQRRRVRRLGAGEPDAGRRRRHHDRPRHDPGGRRPRHRPRRAGLRAGRDGGRRLPGRGPRRAHGRRGGLGPAARPADELLGGPPLALDGDSSTPGSRRRPTPSTGARARCSRLPGSTGGIPEVRGGLAIATGEKLDEGPALDLVVSVVDAATGADAFVVPLDEGEYGFGILSPDGRYLRLHLDESVRASRSQPDRASTSTTSPRSERVTARGRRLRLGLDLRAASPFRVSRATSVEVCDPVTGVCATRARTLATSAGATSRLGAERPRELVTGADESAVRDPRGSATAAVRLTRPNGQQLLRRSISLHLSLPPLPKPMSKPLPPISRSFSLEPVMTSAPPRALMIARKSGWASMTSPLSVPL